MTNKKELALPQKCIVMRNGVEIWVDAAKVEQFQSDWEAGLKGAVRFAGRSLNPMDVSGVFLPEDMESLAYRKNGQWKCKSGMWHDRGEKCMCISLEEKERGEAMSQAIKNCGKCNNGWVSGKNGVRRCLCVKPFLTA